MQQWEADRRREEEEHAKSKAKEKKVQAVVKTHHEDPLYSKSMMRCLKIMERMVVQNSDQESFLYYRYYEDKIIDPAEKNNR
jgi:hypothetical protein